MRATTKSTRSVDRADAVVPAGRRRQHDGAGFGDAAHVVDVGERQRRFARHEDQLAAFLQMHFGGPLDEVAGRAGGHGAERRAAAGANHHAGGEERAAGHRGHEILVVEVVEFAALLGGWELGAGTPILSLSRKRLSSKWSRSMFEFQFLANDVAAGGADREMHVAAGGAQSTSSSRTA